MSKAKMSEAFFVIALPLEKNQRSITDQVKSQNERCAGDDAREQGADEPAGGQLKSLTALRLRKEPAADQKQPDDEDAVRHPMMTGELFHPILDGGAFFLSDHEQAVDHAGQCQ